MSDINHFEIIGRLTKDCGADDFKYTSGGTAVAKLSVAVNGYSTGDRQDVSYFIVKVWGKTAENLKQYFTRGKQLGITGKMKQERWKDQAGTNHSAVILDAAEVQLLGGTSNGSQQQAPAQPPAEQPEAETDQQLEFPEDISF